MLVQGWGFRWHGVDESVSALGCWPRLRVVPIMFVWRGHRWNPKWCFQVGVLEVR